MKKLPKYFIFLALSLLLAGSVCAQENVFGKAKHAVGFSAGGAVGSGLTYRAYSARSFIQGAFFARVNSQENISNLLLGISYGRILSEISIVKALPPTALVFVTGVEGMYAKVEHSEDIADKERENERAFHTGAGIALEIGNTFLPGLLFSLGTTYVLVVEKINDSWEWNLGPQVNLGLLYNW